MIHLLEEKIVILIQTNQVLLVAKKLLIQCKKTLLYEDLWIWISLNNKKVKSIENNEIYNIKSNNEINNQLMKTGLKNIVTT